MVSPADIVALRERWRLEFALAEQLLKQSELLENGVATPVLNELRYSAEHVRRALDPEIANEIACEQWTKAIDHCTRAQYDAAELVVIIQMETIRRFSNDFDKYGVELDPSAVTAAYQAELAAAKQLQVIARDRNGRGDRAREIAELGTTLAEHAERLQILRPRYYVAVRKDAKQTRLVWLGLVIAVIGVVVSVLLSD